MMRLLPLLIALLLPVPSWAGQLGSDACAGSGDLGANWTVVTGFEMPQQTGGICQPKTVNVLAEALYTAISWPNDQQAQVKIVTLSTASSRIGGVVLRGTTAARTDYECLAFGPLGSTTTLVIDRYNACLLYTSDAADD